MSALSTILTRAQAHALLQERIASNVRAQRVDLTDWIFERVHLQKTDRILELGCGTGAQTLRMLQRVIQGQVVAVDISQQSLDELNAKAGEAKARLIPIAGNLDELQQLLSGRYQPASFDLVFCAYGLYYSADARQVLQEATRWLKRNGQLVIVGPFGPNNAPLFELVKAAGVAISKYVMFTSRDFMYEVVIPWASEHYEMVTIHTLVNEVVWQKPEQVLDYWRNTTFYEAQHEPHVQALLESHFRRHETFVNEKWVMLVAMRHARS